MPHKKLPVIKANEQLIADSEFIQEFLSKNDADFYPECSDAQKAVGHSIIRMVEGSLGLALVYDRWLDDACWSATWPIFFEKVPAPLRKFIAGKIRKNVRSTLNSNGFARLSLKERLAKIEADLDALGTIIGTQDFLLGSMPTAADAATLPFLSMIDHLPTRTPAQELLRSKPWVAGYLKRGRDTLYQGLLEV